MSHVGRLNQVVTHPSGTDSMQVLVVALVGNPNCGKTTLFNQLSRQKAPTGNYPRVTTGVQAYDIFYKGHKLRIVDLPGLYSLTIDSPEERYARQFLHEVQPDIIVNVLDAGNLERSLFLSTQLIEIGCTRIFVLNMVDEIRRQGIAINTAGLASMLGGRVVETVGASGEGSESLLEAIMATAGDVPRQVVIGYDPHLEEAIVRVQKLITNLHPQTLGSQQSRWLALKLLEGNDDVFRQEADHAHLVEMVRRERYDLTRTHGEDPELMIAYARYGFIHGLLAETRSAETGNRQDRTRQIDRIILHRLLGLPVFLGLLWVMFETTFTLGSYPTDLIDEAMQALTDWVNTLLPGEMVHDLVVNGVLAGIGGTIVFLPNVVIMFFFMAILSETGYLARTTFLIDRLMHPFGLHGKAFIPLVMGFGCNVPAIMATRTIESVHIRLVAVLVTPFMACSARLPVFILFAGAFFTHWAGTVVFGLYILSIVVAVVSSVLVARFVVGGEQEPFVMELPPYRVPGLRMVLYHMWENAVEFLHKIGSVIILGSIVVWFLQAFPQGEVTSEQRPEVKEILLEEQADFSSSRMRLENSYLGRLGHAVAPLFEPLCFSWKDTTAILTGLVAKEVVVASYAVLYAQDRDQDSQGLREALTRALTPVAAVAFMVFTLLYCPCLATLAAIRRETGSWHWVAFSVVFSFSLAWMLAFLVTMIGRVFT